jgi:hypothetical protein
MRSTQPDDGTRQLLQTGVGTLIAGVLAAVLASTVFGGIGPHGPHTNPGWIALMIAMMCLPFGALAFVLGAAKWMRNRRIAASGHGQPQLPLQPVSRDTNSLLSFSDHSMEQRTHGKERQ